MPDLKKIPLAMRTGAGKLSLQKRRKQDNGKKGYRKKTWLA